MKKFYSLITLLVAMFAGSTASAAIESVTELFGTWTFTADIQFNDDSYKDKILSGSEVIIQEDIYGQFDAEIDGLCGVDGAYQLVSKIEERDGNKVLKITNPNGGGFDAWTSLGLWMTEPDGTNPFGMEGYGPLYYVVNEDGTEIALPDFSFISMSDFSAEKGEIIAVLTNVRLILKEKRQIDIPDISGTYNFKATGTYDYGVIENWPTECEIEVSANDDSFKSYTVSFNYLQFGNFGFGDATFDGKKLSIPYSNCCIDEKNNVYFAPTYGDTLDGQIDFNLTKENNLTLSTGISFVIPAFKENEPGVIDSLQYVFWYASGIAKLPKEGPEIDYSGTYNAVGTVAYDTQTMDVNTEGNIVIEFNDTYNAYVVTEFLGYKNPFTLNYDLMTFTPDEDDPMSGTISCACLASLGETEAGGDYKYLAVRDVNLQENPLKVTIDEDGNMTISDVSFATTTWMGTEKDAFVIYFSKIVATKAKPAAPQDWIGSSVINTVNYAFVAEGETVPTDGSLNVIYDENSGLYLIDNFLTYETGDINYGGIGLVIDENDPHKATLDLMYNYLAFDGSTMVGTCIEGIDGNPVTLTLNDDGTVTIGDFQITKGAWGSESVIIAATVIPAGVISINATELEGKTYDLMGREVTGEQSGIVIRNVGGKFVKVFNK